MSQLMNQILSEENMTLAYKKVKANKGASGIDNVSMHDIDTYLKENWDRIKERMQKRKHQPSPVLRVEIPKANGGVRKLGIPTIVDRIIEQAIVQAITPIVEPHFSAYSYGFRPKRRSQQAIVKLLEYLNDGYTTIVDIDLEKFIDKVPQDKLMTLVGRVIKDPDTESLIAKYLKAGVMVKGKYEETTEGTPQGGNLSPILSNIMLNELDRELEARGLHFVRYADDCVITVKSSAAANRVMHSITKWIERKLDDYQAQIPGVRFYETRKHLGGKASPRLRAAIQKKVETAHEALVVHQHNRKNPKIELGHQGLDHLLPHG